MNNNQQPRSSRFSLFELLGSGSSPMSTAHIIDLISDYNNNIRNMIRLLERADDGRAEVSLQFVRTPDELRSGFSSLFDISANNSVLPASDHFIRAYTTCYNFSVDASGNETTCPISLEPIRDGESVMRINRCGHIFKESALRTWFSRDQRCPVCRGTLSP